MNPTHTLSFENRSNHSPAVLVKDHPNTHAHTLMHTHTYLSRMKPGQAPEPTLSELSVIFLFLLTIKRQRQIAVRVKIEIGSESPQSGEAWVS